MAPGQRSAQPARDAKPAIAVLLAAAVAIAATLLVNQARFGDPLRFGYDADNGRVVPDLARWAGVFVSPGRGLVWEFPAVFLVPLGALALVRSGKARETLVIAALSAPYGAWQFLTHLRPETPLDSHAVDVLWFRLAASTRNWSLLVPVALLAAAAMVGVRARRLLHREVVEPDCVGGRR